MGWSGEDSRAFFRALTVQLWLSCIGFPKALYTCGVWWTPVVRKKKATIQVSTKEVPSLW